MRRINRKKSKKFCEINIVPYVDVMLVLLIIFMATAPLMTQGVKVDLPKTSSKALTEKSTELPIIITIDSSGNYYLNLSESPKKPLENQDLFTKVLALKQINQNRQILIQGDQGVDYGKVVLIMSSLQKIGIEKVGLITVPTAANSEPSLKYG